MTRPPRCISNIAVFFSLTIISESTRRLGSFYLKNPPGRSILVLFKWSTFNSEFYKRIEEGGLGERTSNISPLS